jgi:lipid-A-disaccharide synthase
MPKKSIMIIAGEASGDLHGAKLAHSLKSRSRDMFLFGVGGIAMKKEGVRTLVDIKTLSVMGITEVLAKLPSIYRAMTTVKKALNRLKPNLLILIDFPDFNFHVAAAAKKLGIPVLYYISPKIWAWRQNRVYKIKRLVDHMAVILPFEAAFYRKHRVPVTFVGHPLLDGIRPALDRLPATAHMREPVIGLIPGSREKEVTTMLPVMLQAARIIKRNQPTSRFMVSCAESIDIDLISTIVSQYASTFEIEIVKGSIGRVYKQSRMAIATSGTVTLEAALYGMPTVIIYKVSPLSYWIGKRLVKVKYIGIANLIAQKELQPELIQDDASPETIAATVTGMINDPERLKKIEKELLGIRNLLGGTGASDRVAGIALDLIRCSGFKRSS